MLLTKRVLDDMRGQGQIRVLTTQEVADILKVHRTTVNRLALSGKIPSYKIGASRRFIESDIRELFDNQKDEGFVLEREV